MGGNREKSATHGEQNTGFQKTGQTASFQSDPFFFSDCARARTNPGTQSGTIPSRFHSQFPTLAAAAAAAAAAASRVLTRIASLLQSVRAYYRGQCWNMTVEPPCLGAALCPLFNELIKVISHEATPAKTPTQHSVFSFLFFFPFFQASPCGT